MLESNQIDAAKELLSMIPSSAGSVPTELPKKKQMISDYGRPGPMPQQDAADSHGHEMHPQKLVQLVGSHHQNAGSHNVADSSALT